MMLNGRRGTDLISPGAVQLLGLASLLGALACVCAPSALFGDVQTLGLVSGLQLGAAVGAFVGCAAGPLLLLRMGDVEYRLGLRSVRHLAGQDLHFVSVRYLIQAAVAVAFVAGATAAATGVGAVLDGWGRAIFELEAPAKNVGTSGWAPAVGLLAVSGYLTVMTWLTVLALKSGLRAAVAFAGAWAAWLLGLSTIQVGSPLRSLLSLHPFATPWILMDPIPSSTARLTVPVVAAAMVALLWVVAMSAVARHRVRSPF